MRAVCFAMTLLGGLALPFAAAHSGPTGLAFGLAVWEPSPSGSIASDDEPVDVEDELRLGSERELMLWADLRHRLPLLPQIKLQYTPLELVGEGAVHTTFTFQGLTFDTDRAVSSRLQVDQTDIVLYWTPWRRVLELDLGVQVKYLDGTAEVGDIETGERATLAFKGPLPMAYARLHIRLPGTGLYAGADGGYLSYDGHRVADLSVRAGYRVGIGPAALALEGAWRHQQVRLDDFDGLDADLTLEGPYLGLVAFF